MKLIFNTIVVGLLFGAPIVRARPFAQAQSPAQNQTQPDVTSKPAAESAQTDAYYYFSLGHLQELQFETTSTSDIAEQSIASYKKALEFEPNSAVILERLAEIYAKSQHTRDAVIQAQAALKIDPNNVDAHRLLARIYVRTLGDMNAGEVQQDNVSKALGEFQAVLKIDPSDTYSALWLARLYRFQNKPSDAETVLRGILQHESDNGPALEQLSQLLMDEGKSQDAIDLLTKAAGDSSSPDIYDLLGDAYSQAKQFPQAEVAYRKAVAEDPDDPGHRHGLAEALLSQDKYADALEQFQKLTELEPGTSENYLRAAQLYRRLGQFDKAESSLLRAKQLAPGSLEILYNEALLYEDQGRSDDAVKVLSDAIAGIKSQGAGANPNALVILYEQLGHAYSERGNYSAALDAFEELGKLGADAHKHAQLLIIDVYKANHQLDLAIAEAKKGLSESPASPDLTVALAMIYGEKSDSDSGTQLLKGLLRGNDTDQEIYIDMAQVQERGKKFAEAEQSAQKAEQMASEPSDKQAVWFVLGAIYERQKKFDQAEEQFRRLLDANPNNAAVLNYYGYMLADRGVRVDEATSLIQRALKQEPNNGAYLDSLGWAYFKQNKLTEAEEYLQKAVERDGQDPTVLSHLGNVYQKLGQNERAATLYERSLAAWQKAAPAEYEADKVTELEAQLKIVKRRLAQKTSPETDKPQ